MFDSKSIAKQTLLRVKEAEAEKNRSRVIRRNVFMSGLCATGMIAVMLMVAPFGDMQDNNMEIDDKPVPLAGFALPQADEDAKQIIKISDIEKLVLESALEKGEYDAELILQFVKSDGCSSTSDANINFTLMIE